MITKVKSRQSPKKKLRNCGITLNYRIFFQKPVTDVIKIIDINWLEQLTQSILLG